MDLRAYYKKIRDFEGRIQHEFPVVKSRDTTDGGKSGTLTEVPRFIAAKLVVDGMADLAEGPDLEKFRADLEEATLIAEQRATVAAAMQLTVVSKQELEALRSKPHRGAKE